MTIHKNPQGAYLLYLFKIQNKMHHIIYFAAGWCFWVKPEVTFIYEIIHTLHYNLEEYHSRYSTYVHHLTLSGAIELAMKHYKRYWHIFFFSSPFPV